MSTLSRTKLYEKIQVDGNTEYDYLDSNIDDMELRIVDTVIISDGVAGRPDLLSYKYYKNYDFGWLIAWFNDFLDPVAGLETGTKVKIPSIEDYYRFVNRNKKSN